jgi:3-deoxy-D-manno-octulosonate 8-phosphate phosphatase (KDO 8-P phosphatase)
MKLTRYRNSRNKLLVLDVDGVLTDGTFLYTSEGKTSKVFGPHDADAIRLVRAHAEINVISADIRGFEISKARVQDLNLELLMVSAEDRANFILEKKELGCVAFIGDSFTDVPALREANLSLAPQGSHPLAKKNADITLDSYGGLGAVAEACFLLFPEQFEWAM